MSSSGFDYYNKDRIGKFLQIHHTSSIEQHRLLKLSKDYMLYVQNKEAFVPSSTITIGESTTQICIIDNVLSTNNFGHWYPLQYH